MEPNKFLKNPPNLDAKITIWEGGGHLLKIEATSSCQGRGHDKMYIHIIFNIPYYFCTLYRMFQRNFKKLAFNTF